MRRCILFVAFLFVLSPPAAFADGTLAAPKVLVVPVSQPVQRQVTDFENFAGRTQAVQTVELRARVTGSLTRVLFKDGAEVRQGDLLFEIDARPYQLELDRARAGLTVAEVRLKLAEASAKRAGALAATGGISKEDLDRTVGERAEAEAALHLARVNVELAQLKLSFTRVTAPIDGHIGRRCLDVGNLVKADDSLLATIVSQDPMYANFDVDEAMLLRIRRAVNDGRLKLPQPGQAPLYLGLAGKAGYPHEGTLDFVNNQVNPATGAISVRGRFANPRPPRGVRLFSPGMFVRIRLPLGAPHPALLVIDRALWTDQGAKFVYVLDAKNKVQLRRVEMGALQDDGLRVIESGLKVGDWVVIGAFQRLRPGQTVRPERMPMPVIRPTGG